MRNIVIAVVVNFFLSISFVTANANDKSVYQVDKVKAGNVLYLRKEPSVHSKVIMELPYDVSWMVRKSWQESGQNNANKRWKKIHWGAHEGWVDSYYMTGDAGATKLALEHQQCMKKHSQNYLCCGYPKGTLKAGAPIKAYRVRGVPKGQSLRVRSAPGVTSEKIATLPHNAVGVVKLPRTQTKVGPSIWEQIRWNGRNGWVNSSFLEFDPIISDYRNIVRDICGSAN